MKVENYFVYNMKVHVYLEIENIKFSKDDNHYLVISLKNEKYIDYFIKDCVFDSLKKKRDYIFDFGVYHKNENLINFKSCSVIRYSTNLNLIEILYDYFERCTENNFINELILEQKYL